VNISQLRLRSEKFDDDDDDDDDNYNNNNNKHTSESANLKEQQKPTQELDIEAP